MLRVIRSSIGARRTCIIEPGWVIAGVILVVVAIVVTAKLTLWATGDSDNDRRGLVVLGAGATASFGFHWQASYAPKTRN